MHRKSQNFNNENSRLLNQNLEETEITSRINSKRTFTNLVKDPLVSHISTKNSHAIFSSNQQIIKFALQTLLSQIDNKIQFIQQNRLIKNTVCLTQVLSQKIQLHLNPYESFEEECIRPEEEPIKNITDPISGFNKLNLIKKKQLKKNQKDFQLETQKKQKPIGLPMIKQGSLSKLKDCIPLENQLPRISSKNFIIEEMFRDRLFKQIQNRKIKQKLAEFPSNIDQGKAKSAHQTAQIFRQDCNFDYDGQKIGLFSRGGTKNPLKILKTQYKVVKENIGKNKLQKKAFQKLSFVARTSKVYLQSFKAIDEFENVNYSAKIKQKIEAQLRKGQISFLQKQSSLKQKDKRVIA